MRQLSSAELQRLKLLNENSITVALIEPTATGLRKGIMDATGSVRSYLKQNKIHDFELQMPGAKQHGILVDAFIITDTAQIKTTASLYRPKAKGKGGDPRIWIYGLPEYAKANDILALIGYNSKIWVIDLTALRVEDLLSLSTNNPLKEFIQTLRNEFLSVSQELLNKLKAVAKNGFIKSLVNSDTGVGRTLEMLLGIEMNSSRAPDYKGIELKSFRELKKTRKGLFAKTPNWELSKFKSRGEILDNFGYWQNGVFRLYNTIKATHRNKQGLILKVDYESNWLIENSVRSEINDFLIWELSLLKKSLASKHKETFWISTECKIVNGDEHFLYKTARHTKDPLIDQFELLIEIGAISVDYPIKRLANGSIEDRGCNFKIESKSFDLLFPPSETYNLLS